MRQVLNRTLPLCLLVALLFQFSARAADPIAAITASPISGNAPLGVFFDGRGSFAANTYFWDFGDGLTSNAPNVTHIYTVSGTYTATLVVKNVDGVASAPASVIVTVNGPGSGVVTPNMNFRIAPFISNFKINRKTANTDTFSIRGTFNTVDLPVNLRGVAMSFALNGVTIFSDLIDENSEVKNAENLPKPTYFGFINVREQLLNIDIKRANLAAILATSGAVDQTIPASAPKKMPVTITLTIGAQTYTFTQTFIYSGTQGTQHVGQFSLQKKRGEVGDGFFVISQASAQEVAEQKAHFLQFIGYISEPTVFLPVNLDRLTRPTAGQVIVTLNQADKIFIPFDRFSTIGGRITYLQPDRLLGGVRSLSIDPLTRIFTFSTWDIRSIVSEGGSGLPVRGQSFTTFDFTLRMDIDQPTGQIPPAHIKTFNVVTATRLSRKSADDSFWQTGRKIKRQ